MMSISELREWLDSLESGFVAIDDGGLSLVEVTPEGAEIEDGSYIEIGGTRE